jgi:hypothetical protein
MLHGVKARAVGESPAGENSLCRPIQQEFIDLDEGRGLRRLGGRVRVARPRRDPQRAEGHSLPHPDFKRRDPARDLVQGRKHRNRIGNHRARGKGRPGKNDGEQCGNRRYESSAQIH